MPILDAAALDNDPEGAGLLRAILATGGRRFRDREAQVAARGRLPGRPTGRLTVAMGRDCDRAMPSLMVAPPVD